VRYVIVELCQPLRVCFRRDRECYKLLSKIVTLVISWANFVSRYMGVGGVSTLQEEFLTSFSDWDIGEGFERHFTRESTQLQVSLEVGSSTKGQRAFPSYGTKSKGIVNRNPRWVLDEALMQLHLLRTRSLSVKCSQSQDEGRTRS
jgi:hypothetical protein